MNWTDFRAATYPRTLPRGLSTFAAPWTNPLPTENGIT
jgi:hypothetical protein